MKRWMAIILAAFGPALCMPTAEAAWPHDPNVNIPVCTTLGNQEAVQIISDGAGGAIVVWRESYDLYAHHVVASGEVDPTWPADGLLVCDTTSWQSQYAVLPDGSGGVFLAWQDNRGCAGWDLFALHLLGSGEPDPAWPPLGLAACTAVNTQEEPGIVPDGAGGIVVVWVDRRGDNRDIYAQRVLANGVVDPTWPSDGFGVYAGTGTQDNIAVASDGAGGAVIAWEDDRISGEGTDIFAQRVLVSGEVDPRWPADGLMVSTEIYASQYDPVIVPDGRGGAIVAWVDRTYGPRDIFAQHVLSAGILNPGYAGNVVVCSTALTQDQISMVPDGEGGAFLAWRDGRNGSGTEDVYAHHVVPSGTIDPDWPGNGALLCSASGPQSWPAVTADGLGGVVVTWMDRRTNSYDIYAQRVSPRGAVKTDVWGLDGLPVATAAAYQQYPAIVLDGAGGAIMAWMDTRRGGGYDIYAQRVARFGRLGSPEPEITAVRDVPNDQGGEVNLSWTASWLDTDATREVEEYWVLRAMARDGTKRSDLPGAVPWSEAVMHPQRILAHGTVLAKNAGPRTDYWEYLTTVPARHFVSGYTYHAPTTGDSTAIENPVSGFQVVAWDEAGELYWTSAPDSGYSVDNLAPHAPRDLLLTQAYSIRWKRNEEEDLRDYAVYVNVDSTPDLSSADRVGLITDTTFVLPDTTGGYYVLVTALDIHGNESGPSNIVRNDTEVDVGEAPAAFILYRNTPNPFNPATTLRFTISERGHVVLSVHDITGRLVAMLIEGHRKPGEHEEVWDGRDDSGWDAASGIYFARLVAGDFTATRKMVLLR